MDSKAQLPDDGKLDFVNAEAAPDVVIDSMLDSIEPNRYHVWILVVCGMIWAIDNMVIAMTPFLMCEVTDYYGKLVTSVLAGALFLGMAFGASGWGVVSDWMGRKPATNLSLFCTLAGSVSLSLTPATPYLVGVCTFILGLGVGGNVPVAGCLFGEFFPSHKRSKYMVFLTTIWSLGNILGAGVCFAVFSQSWDYDARYVVASIAPLVLATIPLVMFTIDESPRWLVKNGKKEKALEVVGRMAKSRLGNNADSDMTASLAQNGHNPMITDPTSEMSALEGASIVKAVGEVQLSTGAKLRVMFSPKLRWKTLSLLVTWTMFATAYAMFLLWLPTTLGETSGSDTSSDGKPNCSLMGGLAASIATIPGYIFAFGFLSLLGAKRMAVLCIFVSIIMEVIFEVLQDGWPDRFYWVRIALAVLYAMLTTAGWAGLYAVTTDGYPTVVRNTGFGLCSATNRVGAVLAPIVGGFAPSWTPIPILFVAFVSFAFLPEHTNAELESIMADVIKESQSDGQEAQDPASKEE